MAPEPQALETLRNAWAKWCAQHPVTLLVLATSLAFLPFIAKPFNIDDPLFIWAAQNIRSHPLDPYGFTANWYGIDMPFWQITKNPPFACYYLSLFGSIFGWSEPALHVAMLLPAIAAVVGTYRLAARFCKHPLWAALLALFTPVFLVSGTMVMCDVLMLAFWVWSVVFWMEGAERKRPGQFAVAVMLMTLAALTKYFGACVIPLVAAWSLGRKRPLQEWLGWLAIPVAALIAYQFATRSLYGRGLLTDASQYAVGVHQSNLVTALAFTGGCLAIQTFFAPLLWPRRELLIVAALSLVCTAFFFFRMKITSHEQPNAGLILQMTLWVFGGVSLLAVALTDIYRRRDADSLLLVCWALGTFIFTAFLNWIINGRSLLPMAIPAAILVARRLEQSTNWKEKFSSRILLVPGIAGVILAVWVAAADYSMALAPQAAARIVHSAYGKGPHELWFQGHWGFQYYMQKEGAKAMDLQRSELAEGDYIATPSHNSNVYKLKAPLVELETFSVPVSGWLSTLNGDTKAGFYAAVWGPLPFAFGPIPSQTVTIVSYDPTGEIQRASLPKSP